MPQEQEPLTTAPTPRHQAGSLTMARRTASAQAVVTECAGNLQLLEARVCELTQSIRALHRSNTTLQQALQTTDPEDVDFLQALTENREAIVRQGAAVGACVKAMQAAGAPSVDLEPDIYQIISTAKLEQEVAAADAAAVANNSSSNEPDVSQGLYL